VSKRFFTALAGAGALAVTVLTAGVTGAQAASPHLTHLSGLHAQRACAAKPAAGSATCFAKGLMNKKGVIPYATAPLSTAMRPDQIQAAYGLGSADAAGRTVAIVDAYGYPNLARDLATYRAYYKLPACGAGCLTIVDQNGGSNLPHFNLGWAQEQSLDVDAVSAACPSCHILVVQAKSANFTDLSAAVTTAASRAGVVAISNSYGAGDLADSTYGSAYIAASQKNIAVTASTGDNGYQGASFPASSHSVTAVGGTTLKMTGTNGLTRGSETVWSGAGSGCSAVNQAITAAASYNTGCTNRAMADVSAAADPNYGGLSTVSPSNSRTSSWAQWGGTSESSPIIAAVYALAGGGYSNTTPYTAWTSTNLHDITSGSNGTCPTYQWCHAGVKWDGPTGLGTPNGTGAF
jgi:subtilase family serine protease